MTAGGITSGQGGTLTPVVPAGTALHAGDVVRARVVADLGEGRYALQLQGDDGSLEVRSEVPLARGRELALRVEQEPGRVVLRVLPAGSGQAAAAAGAVDQATVSSPFALEVPAVELAAHLRTGTRTPVVGLVFSEQGVAVHFPDGAVVSGGVLFLSAAGEGAPAGAQASVMDNLAEAVFVAEEARLPVLLGPRAGVDLPATLRVPVASLAPLLAELEGSTAAAAAPVTVVAPAQAGDGVSPAGAPGADTLLEVLVGGGRVRLEMAAGAGLRAGDVLQLRPAPETRVRLLGTLGIAREGLHPYADVVDTGLRAAGLLPGEQERQAAQALLGEGLALNRESVQALMALATGREGGERAALLAAGARLLARGLPLAPPLAAGMEAIMRGGQGLGEALAGVSAQVRQLGMVVGAGRAARSVAAAVTELDAVAVILGRSDSGERLGNFLETFAREPLGRAVNALEQAAADLIAGEPRLGRIDAALAALAGVGEADAGGMAGGAAGEQAGGRTAGALAADASWFLPADPGAAGRVPLHAGVNLDGLPAAFMGAAGGGARADAGTGVDSVAAQALVERILAAPDPAGAGELARAAMENLPRSLRAAVAAQLQVVEQEVMEHLPGLRHARAAIAGLRSIGRRLLVYKADNLAGMRHEPGTFVAEVPFRLQEQDGEGRLQVWYRRRHDRGPGRRWSARVLLDLQTTRLGPVVGDMRFFGREIRLGVFSATDAVNAFLAGERGELVRSLRDKGFACVPRFQLIAANAAPEQCGGLFTDRPVRPEARRRLDLEA